jgi:hypothetical protein
MFKKRRRRKRFWLHFEIDGDSGPGSDDGRSELGVHVISDTASDGGDKGLHESRVIATKKKSFIVSCVTESALQESKITEDETEEHVASDNYISPENTQKKKKIYVLWTSIISIILFGHCSV